MLFFNCNILHGAPITELFWVCLVVSQILGEGALVQMFCWYMREKWGSYFSLEACENCLEVCFMGLVVQRICVWCLVIVSNLRDLDKHEQKGVGCLKVINWEWQCKSQKGAGALFIGKAGSHCVILLYCEAFLQVLLGIYCKRFYWKPSFHYTTVVLRV